MLRTQLFTNLLLVSYAVGAPASSSALVSTPAPASSSPASSSTADANIPLTTAGFASNDPNAAIFVPVSDPTAMTGHEADAIRGTLGAPIIGPQNPAIQFESPDFLAPPSTDAGSINNAKWPFALSHNRIQTGGWARQQNVGLMPIATAMAGVNMRLEPGAVRELHWHTTAEWAYVLKGTTRISAVTPDNQAYLADVHEGDLWYFPPGIPHSLQALNDTGSDGSEFLLVFDDGAFSEDDTLLLTDWLAHVPKEVLAKNFNANIDAFDHIPKQNLYIFPTDVPGNVNDISLGAPGGNPTNPFSFALSQMKATQLAGGTVRIVDSTIFKASLTIAAAEVTVEPGSIRELHWHPTEPEWSFFVSGTARVTLFAGSGNARTFDYVAGDVGYVPPAFGHYVENLGNTTLKYLEIFKSDRYQDIALTQWLALTPPALVKAHLNLDEATISSLSKSKPVVVKPSN